MKSVIFLAPPAAGKGTFSEYLVKNYGYYHLSTGTVLRNRALNDSHLSELLQSGSFVDDDIIMNIIKEELTKLDDTQKFILDGVPRTLQQAKKLDIILTGLKKQDVVVIFIDVDKTVLIDRVIGRRCCPKCRRNYNILVDEFKPFVVGTCDDCKVELIKRDDDNLESFKVRYNTFLERTAPVVAYYKEKGCLKVLQNNEVDQTEALKKLLEVLDVN